VQVLFIKFQGMYWVAAEESDVDLAPSSHTVLLFSCLVVVVVVDFLLRLHSSASASCPSLSLCSGDHQLLSPALYNAFETHSPSERTVLWGRLAFHLWLGLWTNCTGLNDLFRSILMSPSRMFFSSYVQCLYDPLYLLLDFFC
jgi:hypothetical protein